MREIISSIEAEYRRYKVLGEAAIQQLREEELTRSCADGDNSVAVIVWHISGNLKSRFSDFLKSDGEKPWRHRDSEFESRSGLTIAGLLEIWNEGWATFFDAIDPLVDADLHRSGVIRGMEHQVYEILLRMLAHTSYHVGQIVFVAKSFRGNEWKNLSIPLGKSEEYNRNPTREKPPKASK